MKKQTTGMKRLLKLAAVLETKSAGRNVTLPHGKVMRLSVHAMPEIEDGCGCTAAVAYGYRLVPKGESVLDAMTGRFYDEELGFGNPRNDRDNPTPKQVAKRIRAFVAKSS